MKITHIHDTPVDKNVIWILHKSNFGRIQGIRNTKVAFDCPDFEDEQTLLSLIHKVDTLYINPEYVKTPELKNLILRLNPEILL
jgi:hypothetical protein